jgi:hypothetical protein
VPLREALDAHLELEVGNDRHQVGVARALAVAVDGALHVRGAGDDGDDRVGRSAARVVLGVDADLLVGPEVAAYLADDALHLVRQ